LRKDLVYNLSKVLAKTKMNFPNLFFKVLLWKKVSENKNSIAKALPFQNEK